jgi:hypothetical protein
MRSRTLLHQVEKWNMGDKVTGDKMTGDKLTGGQNDEGTK